MTDCDVGEIFLNLMLEPNLRPFVGVDLTCVVFRKTFLQRIHYEGILRKHFYGILPFLVLGNKGFDGGGDNNTGK